jgi:hypothetical protein
MDDKIKAIYLLALLCECNLTKLDGEIVVEILNKYTHKYHLPPNAIVDFISKYMVKDDAEQI